MGKTVGYLRVSTIDQDLDKNRAEIFHLANEKNLGKVHWVEEKVSGTLHWRKRKIGRLIDEMGKGDCLIVSELSRLGRSTLQILEIMKTAKEKELN